MIPLLAQSSGLDEPTLPGMPSVIAAQEAIESIEDVVKWSVRHIPTANPAHQSTLRISCAVMELCLKFRINKEDILTTGEMVARITRSIVLKGIPDDKEFHLDDLTTVFAKTHTYLEETLETTKGWNIIMDKTQRVTITKTIATEVARWQDAIRRTASFLDVDLDIQIVGSVDDLMQDMQSMMDKLGKMDYYISLAQRDGTLNRQIDSLLEMAIQLQRGLDYYHHNISLRNVEANAGFEASVLASFDKVIHAAKSSWRASNIARDLPLDELLEEWMLASEDVVYDPNNKSTFLGQGASAMVYLGQYKGRSVAVKHFHTVNLADSTEFERMIRKEIKAWRDVSNERYILTLIGVCTKISSPIVVCEYCPDTITRYIRLHPEKLIEMVYQFALGLLSLHSAGVIHRDIKGANVLVREDGTVAIADFGLSRSTESLLTQYSNVGRFVGTLNWMSPEQRFSPRKVTVQSDVWSFGMTVWQLVARDIPYRDYCQEEIEEAMRSEDDRPGRPEELSKEYEALWDLTTWCWKLNPFERPKAVDIVGFLEDRFRQDLLSKSRKWRGESSSELDLKLVHETDNQHAPSNMLKGQETTKPEMVPAQTTNDSSNPYKTTIESKSPSKVSGLARVMQKSATNLSNAATEMTTNDSYYSRSAVSKNSSDNFKLKARKSTQQSISSKPSIWKRMTAAFNPSTRATTTKSPPDMWTLPTTSQSSDEVPMNDLAMVRIDARAVSLENIIGSGALSVVWRATLDDEIVVARKLRSSSPSSSELKSFIQSIQLMSRLDSPYVVKFIGAAWNQPSDLMCVTEWMDGGDLRDKLSKTTTTSFPWRAKVEIIYQVVQALIYVHAHGVIHRDIKSRNVLLDNLKPAKLINVGTLGDYIQASIVSGAGTFRWMAPEVIMNQTYTDAADIYSLGVVLSEMDSHQLPYHDRVNESGQQLVDTAIILKVASGSFKPTFTDQCPEWIHSMAMKCLSFNPTDRPSATELKHTLEEAMSHNDEA